MTEERLRNLGFEVRRDDVGGRDVVVGRRAHFQWWTLTRLHVFAFLFDAPDSSALDSLERAAREYAVSHKGGLPRALQTGVVSMPVLVTSDETTKAWAAARRRLHFAAFDYPVVIDPVSREAFTQFRRFWGAAYSGVLRRLADDLAR